MEQPAMSANPAARHENLRVMYECRLTIHALRVLPDGQGPPVLRSRATAKGGRDAAMATGCPSGRTRAPAPRGPGERRRRVRPRRHSDPPSENRNNQKINIHRMLTATHTKNTPRTIETSNRPLVLNRAGPSAPSYP